MKYSYRIHSQGKTRPSTNMFPTAQKTETMQNLQNNNLNEILQQECPHYMEYKQRTQTPIMQIKEFKQPKKDPSDHKDYLRFKKMKDNFVKEYKGKLDEYFEQNKTYERRFFKIYHRRDQVLFKHRQQQKKVENPEVTDMLLYNQIMQMNQQQTQRANQYKFQEKRRRELKQEEKEEKEYVKGIMEKFLIEEQKYFDRLQTLGQNGQQNFQESISLRNKYTHDYIKEPQREFVEKKDLIILNGTSIPETIGSSVISNAGSVFQSQVNMQYQSGLSSYQQIPSIQNVLLQRQSTNQLYQLPVPQLPEYELQLGDQIKKPSTYQTEQIIELYRLITLNEKIEFTFRLVSNPELIQLIDANGQTLLHQAALKERNGIAKFLLIKGIDYQKRDNKGRTAYDIALKQKNQSLVDYIVRIQKKGQEEID